MSKFIFRNTAKINCDPVTAIFKPGIPFGMEYFRGDLVLFHPEITVSKVFLNSKILREAILNSKDIVEEMLGLTITDALNKIEEAPVEIVKKNSKKAKVVEEIVIEGVNEVPENAEVKDEVVIDAPAEVAEEIANSLILDEEPLEINE